MSASGHVAIHAGQWKHCGLCIVVSPLGYEFGMTCWVMVGGGGRDVVFCVHAEEALLCTV